MAREIGLTAKLKFQGDAAIGKLKKTGTTLDKLKKSAKLAKQGIANIKQGFAGLTIAGVGLGAGIAKSIKDFGEFNFQITKVKSLTTGTGEDMKNLEAFAKQMGATTFFSAQQAAQAMESLARGGLNARQIMAALPSVLQLATAESLDLNTAASIVIKTSKAFGVSMKKAVTITDTLAFVSKNTATDVRGLFEGIRFTGTKASALGIPLLDTAKVLGLLADVGVDASRSGTALNNALVKLGQNQKRGAVKVGQFTAKIAKGADGNIDLIKTFQNIIKQADKIKDPLKRSAALTKLLGIRGENVGAAFAKLTKSKIDGFLSKTGKDAAGAAKALADAQKATALGQFKIFKSSLSAVSTEIGALVTPALVPFMKRFAVVLGDAAKAMSLLLNPTTKSKEELGKLSGTGVQVAQGLIGAFNAAKSVFSGFVSVIKRVGSALGFNLGGDNIKGIITLVGKTIAWGVSLKVVGGILGRLGNIAKGTFQLVKGGLGAVATIGGGLIKKLGSKVPLLAKLGARMPGLLGKFSGAISGVEKLTAQPVRIVNFDEAGGILGAASPVGAGGGGILSSLGSLTKKLATATGGIKNLALRLAAKGGLVAAAGAAGFAIGTLIDRTFGLSDKISTLAFKQHEKLLKQAAQTKFASEGGLVALKNLQREQARFAALAARGVTFQTKGGGRIGAAEAFKKRAAAEVAKVGKGLTPEARAQFQAIIDSMATKVATAVQNVNVTAKVNVDGREVGKATAKANQDADSRTGGVKQGQRGRTARR